MARVLDWLLYSHPMRLTPDVPFHLPANVDPRDRMDRIRGYLLLRKARKLRERAGQKRRGIRE